MEVDKLSIMRRCDLPARDLRLLDPLFVYPSTLLGREKAIVVNLEQIRCIITADEVLLLNTLNHFVLQYVHELQRRLKQSGAQLASEGPAVSWRSAPCPCPCLCRCCHGCVLPRLALAGSASPVVPTAPCRTPQGGSERMGPPSTTSDSHSEADSQPRHRHQPSETDTFSSHAVSSSLGEELPFEFRALEVALEGACTLLDSQAAELEGEAYPALDELCSVISTLNLERVRRLKSRLVALTRRVQKVRDEIEQLMDDDGDMVEMYLTEKKEALLPAPRSTSDMAAAFGSLSRGAGGSFSAPVSPVGSPRSHGGKGDGGGSGALDRTLSYMSQRGSESSATTQQESVEELEMLLEAYFVVIDSTLNKLTALKEYTDDTKDFINIQLDNTRNKLIQFELLMTTVTLVVAIYGMVAGVFGMNIPIGLEQNPYAFKWVIGLTGISGMLIFIGIMWYFRHKKLMLT
eukprot:SM000135S27002  [mRNA]  locus=s135:130323:132545:- [translate_table: standard]